MNRLHGFHGSCHVLMVDGSYKKVKNIRKGDLVMTFNRKPARVIGIMITRFPEGNTDLVKIGHLLITPYQPVLFDNHWMFPKDVVKPETYNCTEVCSFVIESNHIVLINNVPCVCLGHNMTGPVVGHPFFGTDCILRDLEQFSSWGQHGLVEINSDNFSCNPKTNLVDGIIPIPIPTNITTQTMSNLKITRIREIPEATQEDSFSDITHRNVIGII